MSLAVLAVLSALWSARAFFLARMVAAALGFLFLALLEAEEGVSRSTSSRVTPVFQILAMGLAPQTRQLPCFDSTTTIRIVNLEDTRRLDFAGIACVAKI
ncbi:hypothetical protein PC111_g18851 [Phytophthora cactorum]|nr:hypothetical protein PC111_g18851 [Phytophthora cactorum]